MMDIVLVLAGIGGFIKIIETGIKFVKWADIIISNIKFERKISKRLKATKEDRA